MTGATGATGPLAAANYASILNTSAEVVAVEADILFDANNALSGFTHAPGTSQLVVTNAGVYAVEFVVSGVEPSQFAVFVNGRPIAS